MDKGRVQKEEEKLLEFFINPIAHGPFIHCVPWEGGAESAPLPIKNTLKSVKFLSKMLTLFLMGFLTNRKLWGGADLPP